jgi:hypothetical protein
VICEWSVYEDLEEDGHGLIDGFIPPNLPGYTEENMKNLE